jgi:hypothetical protein
MIVGIAGKARSGKNAFTDCLVEEFLVRGRHFHQTDFADELKQMCAHLFDLEFDQLWGNKKEHPDLRFAKDKFGLSSNPADYWSPREIMQELGSFFRKIDYDFWVNRVRSSIDIQKTNGSGRTDWIITDVRHLNESWYVKQNGFLINIVRKNAEEIHGMSHESETALDNYTDYDMVIENNGSLEDLRNTAKDAVDLILKLENLKGEQKNG